jgi:hypothetical protein
MSAKISLSIHRFELSPETRQNIQAAVEPLFACDCYVGHVDVSIEGEYTAITRILYNVTLRAQLRSEKIFELKQGEKILPTVQAAVVAMQRRLRESFQTAAL